MGILIILCLLSGSIWNIIKQHNNPPIEPDPIEQKVDTFYIVRDSIIHQIDSIEIEKVKIKVVYEEKIQSIDTNSVSADYQFFNEYLRARFDSYYNNDSIETSK